MPQTPPSFSELLTEATSGKDLDLVGLINVAKENSVGRYYHWDKLRHLPLPPGLTHKQWWLGLKLGRMDSLKPIGLIGKGRRPFKFSVPDIVQEALHLIDLGAGGKLSLTEPILSPQTRNQYVISSLIEEAITSSQLEGAITTREVAKQMLQTGRPPQDLSEQMILNNYTTMRELNNLKTSILTKDLVFNIHKLITNKTLQDSSGAGRFRNSNENMFVGDDEGEIYHVPPPAEELEERMEAMCRFANGEPGGTFIHPALRAIILHFWLAYDHPFIDGNGRTARALFYWCMLRNKYWLFEFISISTIIRKSPAKYYKAFLYTETDDNNLTYFIVDQTETINLAVEQLNKYIERKVAENKEIQERVSALEFFNHRQRDLIKNSLKHPNTKYVISGHQKNTSVSYQTARSDLLDLCSKGLFESRMLGKKMLFFSKPDMLSILKKLDPALINKH